MSIQDTHALRTAGKLFKKAVYSSKVPVKTIRTNYEAVLGTILLPNNIDRQEVDVGPVTADLLIPEMAIGNRTILYAHGGGFISGSRISARSLAASIAHESASRLLLPEYRLAPECPFPTALNDLFASYMWLLRQNVAASDIVLAGDGAGANLMLALVHKLRANQVRFPEAIIAISPWVDLACEGSLFSARKNPDPIHSHDILAGEAALYVPQLDFSDPLVSPIHGDFRDFPKLYIQCGSEEILIDDANRLARKAENSGVAVTLDVESGMWHLFQAIDTLTPQAHGAVSKLGKWVRETARGDEA